MRGPGLAGPLRLLAGSALVALFALGIVRGPASGASADPGADSAGQALVLPSPLPSIELPLPSLPLPLPSIDLDSLLPSASLPLPSHPLPSIPLPSVSALPSVPLPPVGTPPPLRSAPGVSPTPSLTAAAIPSPGARSTEPSTGASATPGGPVLARSIPDGGAGVDRTAPSSVGRGGAVEEPAAPASSWLVPSLAFGVPALLVVAAVLAQLVSGAAVLGIARRTLSRFPGPTPRWIRGASDAAAQDAADGA